MKVKHDFNFKYTNNTVLTNIYLTNQSIECFFLRNNANTAKVSQLLNSFESHYISTVVALAVPIKAKAIILTVK